MDVGVTITKSIKSITIIGRIEIETIVGTIFLLTSSLSLLIPYYRWREPSHDTQYKFVMLQRPYDFTYIEPDILWFSAKEGVFGIVVNQAFVIRLPMGVVGSQCLEAFIWCFGIDLFLLYDVSIIKGRTELLG